MTVTCGSSSAVAALLGTVGALESAEDAASGSPRPIRQTRPHRVNTLTEWVNEILPPNVQMPAHAMRCGQCRF
jgi:hypothetical protein